MLVLISGKSGSGKTELANNLKTHWSQRGIATVILNFMRPVHDMHDAVAMVGKRFGLHPPPPGKGDTDLISLLNDWGRKKDQNIWDQAFQDYYDEVTSHWRKQQLFFMAVADDMHYRSSFDFFGRALTVRLECDPKTLVQRSPYYDMDRGHPSQVDLDPYVKADKFDVVIDTTDLTPDKVCEEVVAHFTERVDKAFEK